MTTAYGDNDLEVMLEDLESDVAERKESFKGDVPTKAREAVCAFANDRPDHRRAGVLFLGARDDGSPSGLPVTDELLRQLADLKTDGNIVPPPTLTVGRRVLRGAEIAVVIVEPADSPPVRFKGRIWIRVGPRRATASAQDERILSEKRRHRDQPFDVQPVRGATLDQLDPLFFEKTYLQAAFAPEILAANERTYEQRLAATKMVSSPETPAPTVLGVLVLCPHARDLLPDAYVQFLRVQGRELSDPINDALLIDGTLADIIRRLEEKLVAHNRVAVDFTSSRLERRTYLYPRAALQQLVRNAVMHRSYEATGAPVSVHWYDDRIEITSPGGPYGAVNLANFGRPGFVSYRNPNIAEAMRVLGLVQRFGAGIATARRELQTNGNPPPDFEISPSHLRVTVRPGP